MHNVFPVSVSFVFNKKNNEYKVFLVNPATTRYARVVTLSGAYCTIDGDLVETSKSVMERGALAPQSLMELETGDIDDLEFRVWFHMDLYETKGAAPLHVSFSLPGVHEALAWGTEASPVHTSLTKELALSGCSKTSIDVEIQTMVMDPQVHKASTKIP